MKDNDCLFVDEVSDSETPSLASILEDGDEVDFTSGAWVPVEEPFVLTGLRSATEVSSFLNDWYGADFERAYVEAPYSVRQVIETEMSIRTPAEEKQHSKQLEEAMLKELRD